MEGLLIVLASVFGIYLCARLVFRAWFVSKREHEDNGKGKEGR